MRLEHNKHKCIEVYRSHGDFYWLFSALQVETNFLFVVWLFVCLFAIYIGCLPREDNPALTAPHISIR